MANPFFNGCCAGVPPSGVYRQAKDRCDSNFVDAWVLISELPATGPDDVELHLTATSACVKIVFSDPPVEELPEGATLYHPADWTVIDDSNRDTLCAPCSNVCSEVLPTPCGNAYPSPGDGLPTAVAVEVRDGTADIDPDGLCAERCFPPAEGAEVWDQIIDHNSGASCNYTISFASPSPVQFVGKMLAAADLVMIENPDMPGTCLWELTIRCSYFPTQPPPIWRGRKLVNITTPLSWNGSGFDDYVKVEGDGLWTKMRVT